MLVAVFGPGITNTAIALGIIAIPAIARIARSGFVQQRDSEYVLAKKLIVLSLIASCFVIFCQTFRRKLLWQSNRDFCDSHVSRGKTKLFRAWGTATKP